MPNGVGMYLVEMARELGINAAILYQEILHQYNTETSRKPDEEGYVQITAGEFEKLTTLTKRQQDKAFSVLIEKGFIDSVVKGMPARKYFKILR